MANASLLSKTSHSVADMCTILDEFAAVASDAILFLKHVKHIEILVLPPGKNVAPICIHQTDISSITPIAPLLGRMKLSPNIFPRNALDQYVREQLLDSDEDVEDAEDSHPFRSPFELHIHSATYLSAGSINVDTADFDIETDTEVIETKTKEMETLVPLVQCHHHWLVHNGADNSDIGMRKSKRADQLPWGGVAVLLNSTTNTTLVGRAYCFLPLPILTGLPVHINAAFAVSSNRRQLWKSEVGDNSGSWKGDWNDFLLVTLIPTLYAEAIALCAREWRVGTIVSPAASPSSWLFDATWPKIKQARTDFKNTAVATVQRCVHPDNQQEIFWSSILDPKKIQARQQKQMQLQREQRKKNKNKSKKKNHSVSTRTRTTSEDYLDPYLYTWVTPSKATFMDKAFRSVLNKDSTKGARQETLQVLLSRLHSSQEKMTVINCPEWVQESIATVGCVVNETSGPLICRALQRTDLGLPASELVCWYLMASPWRHQLLENLHEVHEENEESRLVPTDIMGLKIVPLQKNKIGTLNRRSSGVPLYIVAPEQRFQILLGNYHLVVNSRSGSNAFKQLMEFVPSFMIHYNIVSLSPSLLANEIGLEYCMPSEWRGRQCVQCYNAAEPQGEIFRDMDALALGQSTAISTITDIKKKYEQHQASVPSGISYPSAPSAPKLSRKEKKKLKKQQKAANRKIRNATGHLKSTGGSGYSSKRNAPSEPVHTTGSPLPPISETDTNTVLRKLHVFWSFLAKHASLGNHITGGFPADWYGLLDWPIVPTMTARGTILITSLSHAMARGVLTRDILASLLSVGFQPTKQEDLLAQFGTLFLHLRDGNDHDHDAAV